MKVNCGAYMEWYTGGLYKAAKHRVHAPPKDQRNHTRLGVFYFNVPNDEERVSICILNLNYDWFLTFGFVAQHVARIASASASGYHGKNLRARQGACQQRLRSCPDF